MGSKADPRLAAILGGKLTLAPAVITVTKMNLRRAIGLFTLSVSISSCSAYFSDLQFVNVTDSPVVGLTVSDGKKTWKLGDLARGGRVHFSGHLAGEAGEGDKVSWAWRGRKFSGGLCYYTDGSPAKGTIIIAGEKLLYRCG